MGECGCSPKKEKFYRTKEGILYVEEWGHCPECGNGFVKISSIEKEDILEGTKIFKKLPENIIINPLTFKDEIIEAIKEAIMDDFEPNLNNEDAFYKIQKELSDKLPKIIIRNLGEE